MFGEEQLSNSDFLDKLLSSHEKLPDGGLFALVASMSYIWWALVYRYGYISNTSYCILPYFFSCLCCWIDLLIIRVYKKHYPNIFLPLFVPMYLVARYSYCEIAGINRYRNLVWWFVSIIVMGITIC